MHSRSPLPLHHACGQREGSAGGRVGGGAAAAAGKRSRSARSAVHLHTRRASSPREACARRIAVQPVGCRFQTRPRCNTLGSHTRQRTADAALALPGQAAPATGTPRRESGGPGCMQLYPMSPCCASTASMRRYQCRMSTGCQAQFLSCHFTRVQVTLPTTATLQAAQLSISAATHSMASLQADSHRYTPARLGSLATSHHQQCECLACDCCTGVCTAKNATKHMA